VLLTYFKKEKSHRVNDIVLIGDMITSILLLRIGFSYSFFFFFFFPKEKEKEKKKERRKGSL